MIHRCAVVAAAGVGLVLLLTGCPGDADGLTAVQALDRAAQKIGNADAYTADISMSIRGISPDTPAVLSRSTGTWWFRHQPTPASQVSYRQQQVLSQNLSGTEQRIIGDIAYLKIPQMAQEGGGLTEARPWIKISAGSAGNRWGFTLEGLKELSRKEDPREYIKLLTAATDTRQVGDQAVGGVATTHYAGSFDWRQALLKLTPENRAAFKKMNGRPGKVSMVFEVWVDDQQRPRKLALSPAPGSKASLTTTMVIRDYDKPVQIVEPPASQTVDALN